MFELALKAQIPIIGVHTDDPVNLSRVLQLIAGGRKTTPYTKVTKAIGTYVYFTDDATLANATAYSLFEKASNSLIVVNPEPGNDFILDVGELPTPEGLINDLLMEYLDNESDVPEVAQALRGLSLKRSTQVVRLTIARANSLAVKELRRTRAQLGETVQGLIPVDLGNDLYTFPAKLESWLEVNAKFFLDPNTPAKLVPRGVMLEGSPGVGKSMASKAIARYLGVPLYRLDISSTLSKYQGESENRVARSLALVEREGPCVLLLDEMEKVFHSGADEGVTTRIMSTLLWWLADHGGRVLTVMTTNDLSKIPPELYRTGRVDMTMKIPRMGLHEAKSFALVIYQSVMGEKPTMGQTKHLIETLRTTGADDFSHAEVAEKVYQEIKSQGWLDI